VALVSGYDCIFANARKKAWRRCPVWTRDAGLEAEEWQRDNFAADDKVRYTESEEVTTIEAVDLLRITAWMNQLPEDEQELDGPESADGIDYDPGGYPGAHSVEVEVIGERVDSEIVCRSGESASACAQDWVRKLIRDAEAARPARPIA